MKRRLRIITKAYTIDVGEGWHRVSLGLHIYPDIPAALAEFTWGKTVGNYIRTTDGIKFHP